jgi:uncharacterized protein YPO0396
MLDNGYSLTRVELLNWGNFHGYQKLSLYETSTAGPLFQSQPASAILGVNGSGKSTLIDALMIALLPFEGSLKLGVTNDAEGGGSGGRTTRDYVLGKHSSSGGQTAAPETIFGRKDGCSIVLLRFAHNRHADRVLTLGRIWWFQNFKVSDTQLAFLSYENLGLHELCADGKTPPTAKQFRQHLRSTRPSVQLFETMQSYFSALSQALGRISRDDLKILNRAFFVKSISNIDQFIRENMLIEQDSPNLERLMENVRNGKEIAHSIETCETKINAIARILRELGKLKEFTSSARQVERSLRLLSLHREWSEWRDLVTQAEELAKEISRLTLRLPLVQREAKQAEEDAKAARLSLLNDNVEAQIETLEREAKALEEKLTWKRSVLEKWLERARAISLKLPTNASGWERFLGDLSETLRETKGEIKSLALEIETFREKKFTVETAARELRGEFEHIAKSGTLIPRELFEIKSMAIKDLKISASDLMFVGELLQVKREHAANRIAIESVLFPIARNLLCHPDALQPLTRWLDANGLKADLTVKRISNEDLFADSPQPLEVSSGGERILDMLEIRSESEHPFANYLWTWLKATFDYELVDVKRFKSSDGKFVTREGLVKKDRRTMRKLKKSFSFSLGWDNADTLERLTAALQKMNSEHSDVNATIETKLKSLSRADERVRLLNEIDDEHEKISTIETDTKSLSFLLETKVRLLAENPDLQKLRREVEDLDQKAQGLIRGFLGLESDLQSKQALHLKVASLAPSRERDLKNSQVFGDLRFDLGSEEALTDELNALESRLQKRGINRLQYESELQTEAQKVETSRTRAISTVAVNLNQYRQQFNDPNLPYDLGAGLAANLALEHFATEWSAAERRLKDTDLPSAQDKWRKFFDQILLDSVKDMINEIKSRVHETSETITSINGVLKLTNFEDLATEQRYLRIDSQTSSDERVRKFRKSMAEVEKTLGPSMRGQIESQSQAIMAVLVPFVEEFQNDPAYRAFVTDVRNHFLFAVQSLRRAVSGSAVDKLDEVVEVFSGARKDAKSSAQTTQLAYALLASCLAFRFRFHDPSGGADTPRLIILDEFGGKFDNEKPREIIKLLDKMGFQSVLVSPMSKADLLADSISHLVLVHKASASRSKAQSYHLTSRADYDRLLASHRSGPPKEMQT